MDRVWFLTWTTYGTWLPGDERGSVSNVAGDDGRGFRRNVRGHLPAGGRPALANAAAGTMTGRPVWLEVGQAERLLDQFHETASYRGWALLAAAVMANHVHILVSVEGDPEPDTLLRDFKSYGSRCLNRACGQPGGRWWTEGGSTLRLTSPATVEEKIAYVERQPYPLAVWSVNASGERPA